MSDEIAFAHAFRPIAVEVVALAEQTPTWVAFPYHTLDRLRAWSAELNALSPPDGWTTVYDQVRLLVARMLDVKLITPAGKGLGRMIERNLSARGDV